MFSTSVRSHCVACRPRYPTQMRLSRTTGTKTPPERSSTRYAHVGVDHTILSGGYVTPFLRTPPRGSARNNPLKSLVENDV